MHCNSVPKEFLISNELKKNKNNGFRNISNI